MKKKKNKTYRTCIVCRNHFAKEELLRYVWNTDLTEVVADSKQIMVGRGAYCCLNEKCKILFPKRTKVLKKAFRLN